MSDWTEVNGYRVKTIQHGNATIHIHRPILTETETAKREDQVRAALEGVMGEYIRRKESKHYEFAH